MKNIGLLLVSILLFSCNTKAQDKKKETSFPVEKTASEWQAQLTEMQYYVLREAGTERAFTSELNKIYKPGTFVCAACDHPLFEGKYKFDSGSGWPSFDREIKGNVAFETDYDLGYSGTEELCANCGGHLGHVFGDGPRETTGLRHCVNGAALKFVPKKTE